MQINCMQNRPIEINPPIALLIHFLSKILLIHFITCIFNELNIFIISLKNPPDKLSIISLLKILLKIHSHLTFILSKSTPLFSHPGSHKVKFGKKFEILSFNGISLLLGDS